MRRKNPLTDFGIKANYRMLVRNIMAGELAEMVNERCGTKIDSAYLSKVFTGEKSIKENSRVRRAIIDILGMED